MTKYTQYLQSAIEDQLEVFVDWCQHKHPELLPADFNYDYEKGTLQKNKVVLTNYIGLDKNQIQQLNEYTPSYPHVSVIDTSGSIREGINGSEQPDGQKNFPAYKAPRDIKKPSQEEIMKGMDEKSPWLAPIAGTGGTDIGKALEEVFKLREKKVEPDSKLKNN